MAAVLGLCSRIPLVHQQSKSSDAETVSKRKMQM